MLCQVNGAGCSLYRTVERWIGGAVCVEFVQILAMSTLMLSCGRLRSSLASKPIRQDPMCI